MFMRGDVEVDPHAGPRTGEGRAGTDDDGEGRARDDDGEGGARDDNGRAGNIENKLGTGEGRLERGGDLYGERQQGRRYFRSSFHPERPRSIAWPRNKPRGQRFSSVFCGQKIRGGRGATGRATYDGG